MRHSNHSTDAMKSGKAGFFLPEQVKSLHARFSVLGPGQGFPLLEGAGLSQRRVLNCLPPPQVLSHTVQLVHLDQLPSTWQEEEEEEQLAFTDQWTFIWLCYCSANRQSDSIKLCKKMLLATLRKPHLDRRGRCNLYFRMSCQYKDCHQGTEADFHTYEFWLMFLLHKICCMHSMESTQKIHHQLGDKSKENKPQSLVL